MADKKDSRAQVVGITPRSVAVFPKFNKPDTKFHAEGVYESKLRIDPDATDAVIGKDLVPFSTLMESLEELRDTALAEKKAELAASKDPKAKAKAKTIAAAPIGAPDLDDEGDETSNIILKVKMKASGVDKDGKPWTRKPTIFDAKGKKLDPAPLIYSGSTVKCAFKALAYYTPKENLVGVTLYLEGVQVIDLVTGGGSRSAESMGFGVEEGGYEGAEEESFSSPGKPADIADEDF